jgi:integrase/recombinase XerD
MSSSSSTTVGIAGSSQSVERGYRVPCGRSTTGVRNRALLALLYFSGLRTQEALDLRPADIKLNDDGTATLNVRAGKGGKQRHSTLAAPGVPDLASWLDMRAQRLPAPRRGTIFCTHASGEQLQPGQPLDSGYVRAALARLVERSGITKRVHPHGLRHAHASWLHHRGVPLAAIQHQLGHSSPLTTVRYLASIGAHDAHRHVAAAFADAS